MQLVLDIGNTRSKMAIFDQTLMLAHWQLSRADLLPDLTLYPIKTFVWASVNSPQQTGGLTGRLAQNLSQNQPKVPQFAINQQTPVPFNNLYTTPLTLGIDRIAVISAAHHAQSLLPTEPSAYLILDIGTCITADILTPEGQYLGGAISPGWQMRLDAMHKLTARLPAITHPAASPFDGIPDTNSETQQPFLPPPTVGTSTAGCMQTAAFWGIVHECNGYISHYQQVYNRLKVLVCGGDSPTFAPLLTADITVKQHLVLEGLNQIYLFNQRAA